MRILQTWRKGTIRKKQRKRGREAYIEDANAAVRGKKGGLKNETYNH